MEFRDKVVPKTDHKLLKTIPCVALDVNTKSRAAACFNKPKGLKRKLV